MSNNVIVQFAIDQSRKSGKPYVISERDYVLTKSISYDLFAASQSYTTRDNGKIGVYRGDGWIVWLD